MQHSAFTVQLKFYYLCKIDKRQQWQRLIMCAPLPAFLATGFLTAIDNKLIDDSTAKWGHAHVFRIEWIHFSIKEKKKNR